MEGDTGAAEVPPDGAGPAVGWKHKCAAESGPNMGSGVGGDKGGKGRRLLGDFWVTFGRVWAIKE